MKKLVFALLFVGVLTGFTSCKRTCTQCTYYWTTADGSNEIKPQKEVCGSKREIDRYKEDEILLMQQAARAAGGKNATVICIDR